MEEARTGGKAPTDRCAVTLLGDIEIASATKVDVPQHCEHVESLVVVKDDVSQPMEAALRADVPEV
jgi:hypothetical protein